MKKIKKIFTAFLAITIMVSMPVEVFATSKTWEEVLKGSGGNPGMRIKECDLPENEVSTKSIIDPSNPNYVIKNPAAYPYSAICQIVEPNGNPAGTGFLIDGNTVVSAAHVLTRCQNGAWLYFGRRGEKCLYYRYASGSSVNIHPSYSTGYRDIGYIELPVDLTEKCGHFGYKPGYGTFLGKRERIAGYGNPGKYNNCMTRSFGNVVNWNSNRFWYNNNTEGGDSGAPVFTVDSRNQYIAVGVHISGVDAYNDYNNGMPLTVDWPFTFIYGTGGFQVEGEQGFEVVGGTEDDLVTIPGN